MKKRAFNPTSKRLFSNYMNLSYHHFINGTSELSSLESVSVPFPTPISPLKPPENGGMSTSRCFLSKRTSSIIARFTLARKARGQVKDEVVTVYGLTFPWRPIFLSLTRTEEDDRRTEQDRGHCKVCLLTSPSSSSSVMGSDFQWLCAQEEGKWRVPPFHSNGALPWWRLASFVPFMGRSSQPWDPLSRRKLHISTVRSGSSVASFRLSRLLPLQQPSMLSGTMVHNHLDA